ncbi:MAG: hypothetical protein D6727_02170 [Gammaproteobacteria bacterium]|nr:MAG: hypothetical protein D6727_02170 [Gammaproteobacteria bacterium]
MRKTTFSELRQTLQAAGVCQKRIARLVGELTDHLEDLEHAALEAGNDAETAGQDARILLGDERLLAETVLAEPSAYHSAGTGLLAFADSQSIRWGIAALLGGSFTIALLFLLQLAILG